MITMPNPTKWIIFNANGSSAIGDDLNQLNIKKTANNYELYAKLQSVPIPTGPPSQNPIKFLDVTYDDLTWDITVTNLPNAGPPEIAGTWVTPSASAISAMRD